MNAEQVHAVLARGVSDPRRLNEWASNPQALRTLGVDPASLDLAALRGFAGLALKVRHNGLRGAFLHSFRLLHAAGLEIEVFADYALALATAGEALASTDTARARALIAFVQRWHDPSLATHSLLWDLLRHESALFELAHLPAETRTPAARPAARPTPRAVMRVRGAVRLHEMQHKPSDILLALRQREPDLTSIAPAASALCYWRPPDEAAVRIVELDAFGFAAVQAGQGQHLVAELSMALGLGSRVPDMVRTLLEQLRELGLLAFERPTRSATQ